MFLARLHAVRFVHHAIQLEARLGREVKNLRWTVISGATWRADEDRTVRFTYAEDGQTGSLRVYR